MNIFFIKNKHNLNQNSYSINRRPVFASLGQALNFNLKKRERIRFLTVVQKLGLYMKQLMVGNSCKFGMLIVSTW